MSCIKEKETYSEADQKSLDYANNIQDIRYPYHEIHDLDRLVQKSI